MVLTDFNFAGKSLSEQNCIICSIVTANSDSISLGSTLTLNTITSKTNFRNTIIDVSYDTPITATFDIMKMNCMNVDDMYFSDKEVSHMLRWLNRKTYQKFIPIYDNDTDDLIYYYGTFTEITACYIGGNIIGFTLTFTANAPWGLVDVSVSKKNIQTLYLYNDSDDIGLLYPNKFNIKLLGGTGLGTDSILKIYNGSDKGHTTTIANCKNGETINMDCIHEIIESDSHDTLYNDFNYKFPRLKNDDINGKNVITFSIPCDVDINYQIVRKVGIMV